VRERIQPLEYGVADQLLARRIGLGRDDAEALVLLGGQGNDDPPLYGRAGRLPPQKGMP
jgi:hypothetical protein